MRSRELRSPSTLEADTEIEETEDDLYFGELGRLWSSDKRYRCNTTGCRGRKNVFYDSAKEFSIVAIGKNQEQNPTNDTVIKCSCSCCQQEFWFRTTRKQAAKLKAKAARLQAAREKESSKSPYPEAIFKGIENKQLSDFYYGEISGIASHNHSPGYCCEDAACSKYGQNVIKGRMGPESVDLDIVAGIGRPTYSKEALELALLCSCPGCSSKFWFHISRKSAVKLKYKLNKKTS